MSKILFQNSVNGYPSYNAEDFTKLFSKIISNGVIFGKDTGNLGVSIFDIKNKNNPQAVISPGTAVIDGAIFLSDSDYYLMLPAADSVEYKVYGILLELDKTDLSFYFKYTLLYQGTEKPSTTEILNLIPDKEPDTDHLLLATITLPPLATTTEYPTCIERHADKRVCGYVCWLLDNVDTDDYFESYERSLTSYTNKIEELVEEVAGNQKLKVYSFEDLPTGKQLTLKKDNVVFTQSAICEVYLNGFKYDYKSVNSNLDITIEDGAIKINAKSIPWGNRLNVVVYTMEA